MKKGITVILCTYNGATRLATTLNHLAAQQTRNGLEWELILVDNASTDNSGEIAKTHWDRFDHDLNKSFTLVHESRPGKIFAFQKGISIAKYEYFIICDDDNWLKEDYLQIAFDIIDSSPQIGALGGQAVAAASSELPDWLEAVREGYAIGPQAKDTGDVTYKGNLWGAGLVSRTQLYLEAYGTFPSLLINKNDQGILTAEDSEYCLRLVLKGHKLHYDTKLVLQHFIPDARLTSMYKTKLYDNFRKSNLVLENYRLAMKYGLKGNLSIFNRIRLTCITPIRYMFSSSFQKKSKQRIIMCYLFSFIKPDPITAQIKALMKK